MADGGHLGNQKLWYLLADFDEILHEDTLVLQSLPGLHKINLTKSKMADDRHFQNVKGAISAAVRPILTKFGMTMHISSPNMMGD